MRVRKGRFFSVGIFRVTQKHTSFFFVLFFLAMMDAYTFYPFSCPLLTWIFPPFSTYISSLAKTCRPIHFFFSLAKMALQKLVVIWLDGTFAGDNDPPMKEEFNKKIASSASPSDSIDSSICNETKEDLVTNGTVVITVGTPDEAIRRINDYSEAKIFFISSGSLGKDMVPRIVQQYLYIHSFYIYCFKMVKHTDWASEYASCLQMFDHPVDLLVRLMRDISDYFIQQGKAYLGFGDANNALKYFKHSWNLETRANEKDKMKPNTKSTERPRVQPDYRRQLDKLEGENGLIRQAEKALDN